MLMRELCNTLILQAQTFVSGESLFENIEEPQEAVENLKTCLKNCVTFKSTYFDYKSQAAEECPSNPWRFQNSALFVRLDTFLERCHDVLDLMQTILQFNKVCVFVFVPGGVFSRRYCSLSSAATRALR